MKAIKIGDVFTYEGELYVVTKDRRPKGSDRIMAACAHDMFGEYAIEYSFIVHHRNGARPSLKIIQI